MGNIELHINTTKFIMMVYASTFTKVILVLLLVFVKNPDHNFMGSFSLEVEDCNDLRNLENVNWDHPRYHSIVTK